MNFLAVALMWMAMQQAPKTITITCPTTAGCKAKVFRCQRFETAAIQSDRDMPGIIIENKAQTCMFDVSVVMTDVTINGEHFVACGPTNIKHETTCYKKPTKVGLR